MRIAIFIFKFFASLKLAIFLLLSLALVFAGGTFTEAAYGPEAAKILVYRSPWLSLLLLLLVLNLLASALDRLPWKKKHVGFVITHAGIILLLAGSLVTRAYGVEGQLAVQEGETASRIILNEAMLQVIPSDGGPSRAQRIPPRAFPWKGRERLDSDFSLVRYYPKSSREERVEASPEGPAALQMTLQSSWMKVSHWLVLDDPARETILLGPAELRFTRDRLTESRKSPQESFLEFQFEKAAVRVPLGAGLGKKIPLEGTPYSVTILRVLKDAMVDQDRLVDRSGAWNNPACELILEGPGFKETHTLFSNYPDFPTLHGLKPSQAEVQIFYRRPEETGPAKNQLRFVWQDSGPPLYQVQNRQGLSEDRVQPGKEYETGWMDFKFRVEHYLPHARVLSEFVEEPVNSPSEEHLSAIEIEWEEAGRRKSLWLGQGDEQEVMMDGKSFQLIYGLRTEPMGFRLALRDFRVENYPGTSRPESFESDVTIKDDSSAAVRDVTIRMNQPLRYKGYKVFQSGYQQPPGEREISVFTVAKDPGIPLKYPGALILIGGILIMFYTRRFSNRPHPEVKEAELVG